MNERRIFIRDGDYSIIESRGKLCIVSESMKEDGNDGIVCRYDVLNPKKESWETGSKELIEDYCHYIWEDGLIHTQQFPEYRTKIKQIIRDFKEENNGKSKNTRN